MGCLVERGRERDRDSLFLSLSLSLSLSLCHSLSLSLSCHMSGNTGLTACRMRTYIDSIVHHMASRPSPASGSLMLGTPCVIARPQTRVLPPILAAVSSGTRTIVEKDQLHSWILGAPGSGQCAMLRDVSGTLGARHHDFHAAVDIEEPPHWLTSSGGLHVLSCREASVILLHNSRRFTSGINNQHPSVSSDSS